MRFKAEYQIECEEDSIDFDAEINEIIIILKIIRTKTRRRSRRTSITINMDKYEVFVNDKNLPAC